MQNYQQGVRAVIEENRGTLSPSGSDLLCFVCAPDREDAGLCEQATVLCCEPMVLPQRQCRPDGCADEVYRVSKREAARARARVCDTCTCVRGASWTPGLLHRAASAAVGLHLCQAALDVCVGRCGAAVPGIEIREQSCDSRTVHGDALGEPTRRVRVARLATPPAVPLKMCSPAAVHLQPEPTRLDLTVAVHEHSRQFRVREISVRIYVAKRGEDGSEGPAARGA